MTQSKKVLFFCGGLEPGRDGVGDYTRRLAGELLKMGCQAAIVALYDSFTSTPINNSQIGEGREIQTLRLPRNLTAEKRIRTAREFVNQFKPDVLSLQFVLYAFHPKGLPFSWESQLRRMSNDIPWHIMFHELWIGMGRSSSLKDKILGSIQQRIINRLFRVLKPLVVHSHTSLYIHKLELKGITTHQLPLFSNIPVSKVGETKDKTLSFDLSTKRIDFVLFGHIHPDAPIDSFAKGIADFVERENITITMTLIGRNGAEKERWKNTWTESGLELYDLGEQSTETVSEHLAKADIGITTTPLLLVEKSGTVAAMQAHALPIICISRPWKVKNYEPRKIDRIRNYKQGVISQDFLQFYKEDDANVVSLSHVAKVFLENLHHSYSNG